MGWGGIVAILNYVANSAVAHVAFFIALGLGCLLTITVAVWRYFFMPIPMRKLGRTIEIWDMLRWESDELQTSVMETMAMSRVTWWAVRFRRVRLISQALQLVGQRGGR